MNAQEKKAIELIKKYWPEDISDNDSYQDLIEHGYYGFGNYYLALSKNNETMSTTADYNVAIQLAKIDKQRDNKNGCSLLL